MAGRKIVIEFLGKDKSAGSTAANVEKKFGKLGGKLDRVGQAAGKVLLGGTVLAAGALYKMGQAAAEDEAAATKLSTALKNAAGATDSQVAATEKWITAQGRALGVTDDELRPALAKLAGATKDVDEAQRLASLAMDISAGSGKSLESVSTALAKAANGNVAGLSKLNIKTKESVKDATALKSAEIRLTEARQKHSAAVKEFGGKSKEAKNAQAKLEYAQMKVGEANGKVKNTTIDAKEAMKRLADTYGGQAAKAADTTAGKQKRLKVVLGELGEEIGARALPLMQRLAEIGLKMADWVGRNQTLVGALVIGIAGLATVMWVASVAMRAWATATKIWAAVTKIAAGVQWAMNAAMAANPVMLVVIAIAALIAVMIIAYKKSETFRKIVDGAFRGVQKAASFAFNWVKKNWPLILAILTGPIGIATLLIVKNWGKIKAGAQGVVDFVKSIPGRLADLAGRFGNAGRALIGAFVDGMKNAAGIISGIAGNVWSAVRSLLNGAIRKINSALEFKISVLGKGISINPPDIPELATGGIVSATPGGRLVRVAEGGHDEAIVPLSGPNAPRMGGSQPIVLQLFTDGRMVEQILVKRERDTGRPLQFRARTT